MTSFYHRSLFKCSLEIGLFREHNWRIKLTVFFLANRLIYIPCKYYFLCFKCFCVMVQNICLIKSVSFLVSSPPPPPVIRVSTPDGTELCWIRIWSMGIWMLMLCDGMFRSVWDGLFFSSPLSPKQSLRTNVALLPVFQGLCLGW